MHWHIKKLSVALGMATALLGWSVSGQSQTFDTPVSDFVLEALPPGAGFPFPNLPLTLNAGNFDASIVAAGDITLNEVAIAGISAFDESGQEPALVHRYWTIVHDSATDTRSLVQTTPSDIRVTSEFEPFYLIPDSLQLLDLNRDGVDDIGLLGAVLEFEVEPVEIVELQPIESTGVKLVKSGFAGPVGVFGVPSQSGPEFFATSLNLLGQQTDASIPTALGGLGTQPSLTMADFDGDGNQDLAFYDFIDDESGTQQLAVTLRNDGGFGTLPRTDTVLNLPVELQGADYAFNLVAADIDGDGAPDLAITFDADESNMLPDMLLVFKGNGDGSFVPDPIASVTIGTDTSLLSLTVGNFDGDEFLDFAVGSAATELGPLDGSAQLNVILCNPGTPASCALNAVVLDGITIPLSLASADFDADGLDDLALTYLQCIDTDNCDDQSNLTSGAAVHLNQSGSFSGTPDQTLLLGGISESLVALQIVAKDIDACGGPDLAYTGFQFEPETEIEIEPLGLKALASKQGVFDSSLNLASVAFNHNDDPVADAGIPVSENGGFRVGGDPTCLGEAGETLNIQWEVLSGEAEISDATAANPLVSATTDAVLQVTCSDACGASSAATVTVQGGNILLNGSGCSLSSVSTGGLAWLLGLAGFLPLAALRRRR